MDDSVTTVMMINLFSRAFVFILAATFVAFAYHKAFRRQDPAEVVKAEAGIFGLSLSSNAAGVSFGVLALGFCIAASNFPLTYQGATVNTFAEKAVGGAGSSTQKDTRKVEAPPQPDVTTVPSAELSDSAGKPAPRSDPSLLPPKGTSPRAAATNSAPRPEVASSPRAEPLTSSMRVKAKATQIVVSGSDGPQKEIALCTQYNAVVESIKHFDQLKRTSQDTSDIAKYSSLAISLSETLQQRIFKSCKKGI